MRDNPWPSIPRGLQHARRSLRALVAHAKRSSSGSTPSPSPAPSPSVPSARPRSLSLAPRPPPASPSPSPRTPSTPGPAARPSPRTPSTPGPAARPPPAPAGYARPASTPTRTGGMTLPPQRPARRLPAVHSVRDYPEHLNPFRDDEEAEAAAPPALPGMEDDEPTLRPTQDKFGTWTVPRRRSHLNFEQTWTSREYPSTAATPPSPASRGHNGSAAPPRPPVGPRVAAASGPGTSAAAGTPTPAPRPPVKPRKKRKAPPPPPPKAQQRLSSAVSLPQLSQDLAGAQPGVPVHQSQSQASLASGPDEPSRPDAAVSRSASPEERVSPPPPPPGAPEPTAPLHDEGLREPHPASGSPAAVHTTEPEAAAEAPRDSHETAEARTSTSTPPAPREQERRSASPTAAEDEARPATPPREQEPRSASPPAAEDEARPATPPREGDQDGRVTPEDGGPSTPTPGHERARAESASPPAPARRQDPLHDPPVIGERPPSRSVTPELPGCSPTPSPRSSPSRSSSSPEPPLPPPPALSPGSADTSPAPQRAARAASEECPSPPTPASPCSGSSATSPTAPTPPPPTPPASPGPPERPHCPLAQPEDPDEEEGAEAEGLSQVVPPGASLVTSPRPHLQV